MAAAGIQRLNKEQQIFPYKNLLPRLHETVFLASGVKIIGDVEIGARSSVWYNSVIRGDIHYIRIGEDTNIQDCSMLHVTHDTYPVNIGNKVTIGHSVKLHGCTINDLCLIGIGAVLLDGSIVDENAMVAAGAVVRPGFVVPSGKLAAGVPAKIVRDLTKEEIAEFEITAEKYLNYTKATQESLNKMKINSSR
jgi:carbonic anhydrase/acetyltransferase-like protein (isoleucine patch superfamily)